MKIARTVGLILAAILLLVQFLRPDMSAPSAAPELALAYTFPVQDDVASLMERSCNDCHSNTTDYPWYSQIQPIGWWIQSHIDDARGHLNFDEFGSYRPFRQYRKFQEIEGEIRDEIMPLESYLPLHQDARLSEQDRKLMIRWSQSMRDSMMAWYPQDSLQRRRNK